MTYILKIQLYTEAKFEAVFLFHEHNIMPISYVSVYKCLLI